MMLNHSFVKTLKTTPEAIHNGIRVDLCLPEDSQRSFLESFISQVFQEHYQANIKSFYPQLLSISTQKNQLSAVAGLRNGKEEPFFSENYLNFPLDSYLNQHFKQSFYRGEIVEVGNLAPAHIGQMRWLVTALSAFLYGAGYKIVIFTAIKPVFNAFKRMGLDPIALAPAKRESLSLNLKKQWTDEYYKHQPYVYVGDIRQGADNLFKKITTDHPTLMPLWNTAYEQGVNSQFVLSQ